MIFNVNGKDYRPTGKRIVEQKDGMIFAQADIMFKDSTTKFDGIVVLSPQDSFEHCGTMIMCGENFYEQGTDGWKHIAHGKSYNYRVRNRNHSLYNQNRDHHCDETTGWSL